MPYSYAPGTTCLMTLIRSLPASGLTSHPVAPRRLPSARLIVSLSVVSVRIGVKRKAERTRTFSINSSPPMPGMLMSVRIKSGLTPDFNLSSAAWPLLADSTLKPLMLRVVLRLISMVAEASSTRIVNLTMLVRAQTRPRRAVQSLPANWRYSVWQPSAPEDWRYEDGCRWQDPLWQRASSATLRAEPRPLPLALHLERPRGFF